MLVNTHHDECGMWTLPYRGILHEMTQLTFRPSETKAWLAEVRYNTTGDAQVTKIASFVSGVI